MFHDLLSENVTHVLLARSSASQRCSLSRVPTIDVVHGWVLYSRFALRAFLPSILLRPFRVSCSASSLFCLLRLCPAQRVILILAAVTSFRSTQLLRVQDFLKMFLLRHATVARRVIPLQIRCVIQQRVDMSQYTTKNLSTQILHYKNSTTSNQTYNLP
jgi:hypothetical protein